MTDHERIWLEPSPGADEEYGRQWCQHNVWDEATEYVRADLHEATVEERDRLREALQKISQLDYTRAAVNGCASTAVKLACAALSSPAEQKP
ncbi:hypothetical protein CHY08_34170 (plasmid) [Rhizobium leguminosarum bv. viciae]|uniref:hypothetical protein n=1 Tax=Rhizobium leguminosarum TaxID=384 RepID=UPI000B8C73BC|nr:hypothetical protein [Rhizobium leguminosarum]ASR12104.1 hypothetical protein CHY08_34170 [Rhizobium leguminosarum bv. viciae]